MAYYSEAWIEEGPIFGVEGVSPAGRGGQFAGGCKGAGLGPTGIRTVKRVWGMGKGGPEFN